MSPPVIPRTSSNTGTFYLAYGSNLSPYQMSQRCRDSASSSIPVAIVRLDGWHWFICERGYANIAEAAVLTHEPSKSSPAESTPPTDSTVWGVIYNMTSADECMLDKYEGHNSARNPHPILNPHPQTRARNTYLQGEWDYNKFYETATVTRWLVDDPCAQFGLSASSSPPDSIVVLVYVDQLRLTEGRIVPEYVGRMNRAIDESVALGVPADWVENTMRKWVKPGIYPALGYVGTVEGYVPDEETEASELIPSAEVEA